MKIYSMTGYGRGDERADSLVVKVEIKSTNHRFIESRFRIPSDFFDLEIALKRSLSQCFKRGSFEVFISVKNWEEDPCYRLDEKKIELYLEKFQAIAGDKLSISPVDFLRSEFYKDDALDESQRKKIAGLIEKAFKTACSKLLSVRLSEGERMVQVMTEYLDHLDKFITRVDSLKIQYQGRVEEKLKKRLEQHQEESNLEEKRFYQEVIFYLEKLDIDEEVQRIFSHLQEMRKLFNHEGQVGRKIEFLLQELNREINTIGSKSGLKEISEIVVSMKVYLEKIREQALNLE
jgi:uncharacterized protein (TIGR00255 family)